MNNSSAAVNARCKNMKRHINNLTHIDIDFQSCMNMSIKIHI